MLSNTLRVLSFTLLTSIFAVSPAIAAEQAAKPRVSMQTSMGNIVIELYPDKAPQTVKNFLGYVKDGAYDGTIFHRVIKDFMNQGGGFAEDGSKRDTGKPITNEADNGLKNEYGTIAIARTNQPHSATNQFFINTANNSFLNHTGKSMRGWGYAVFGKVTDGMEVMDKVANTKTHIGKIQGRAMKDVPVKTIVIKKMSVIE